MSNKEYLTVGQMSKRMDITVRTLQYYDKEGLLTPSAMSEGGRRLYTSKDIIKLHQILSFKYLGFSLEDIKEKILKFDNPEDVIVILEQQEVILKKQIEGMESALTSLTAFKDEVKIMHDVNFDKYADIITLLRMNNNNYKIIKTLDSSILDHMRNAFEGNKETADNIQNTYFKVVEETIKLKKEGCKSNSKEAILLAKKWWDMVLEFTGGDMSLLPKLMEYNNKKENWDQEMAAKQKEIDTFIGEALDEYFKQVGIEVPEEV